MATQSKKFAKNYEILAEINEKLQEQQDNPALLDELAPMLEQASKCYQLCKERIAASHKIIDEF
ncbi:hypothetical protein NAI47_10275, partial [Francisella tularensis subsp. holarctica]|uniref:exodeoxyribonuclease VII small subunit n=1 Tax=Francisella tularensis TaxID=263 RepID=UPI002381A3C1